MPVIRSRTGSHTKRKPSRNGVRPEIKMRKSSRASARTRKPIGRRSAVSRDRARELVRPPKAVPLRIPRDPNGPPQRELDKKLIEAGKAGNLREFNRLVKQGAYVGARDSGVDRRSIAHHAAEGGKANILKAIWAREPLALYATDSHHQTPLHKAAQLEKVDIVKLWRSIMPMPTKRADLLKQANDLRDDRGYTPMHVAAETGNKRMVTELHELNPQFIHVVDYQGESAVHKAVRGAHLDVLLELDRLDANVLSGDRKGVTPLDLAHNIIKDPSIDLKTQESLQAIIRHLTYQKRSSK